MAQVKCEFCEQRNEPGRSTCANCGGPLPDNPVQQSGPPSGQFAQPYSPYGQPGYGQPGYGQQPMPYGGMNPQQYGPPPSNNLVFGILTLFCCWPLAIVSIVKANQVNTLWAQGRQVEARQAASSAATWATIALICGLISGVFWFIAEVASH